MGFSAHLNKITAAHIAAKNNNLELLELLKNFNANLAIKDAKGKTPFEYAYKYNKFTSIMNSHVLDFFFEYYYANKNESISWIDKNLCHFILSQLHLIYRDMNTSDALLQKTIRTFLLCGYLIPDHAHWWVYRDVKNSAQKRMNKETGNIVNYKTYKSSKSSLPMILEIAGTRKKHDFDTFFHLAVRNCMPEKKLAQEALTVMIASTKNWKVNINTDAVFRSDKALHHAIKYENLTGLACLSSQTDKGVDIAVKTSTGYTALHLLAMKNTQDNERIKDFCNRAFDIIFAAASLKNNDKKDEFLFITRDKSTALHEAAKNNKEVVVKILQTISPSKKVELILQKNKKGNDAIKIANDAHNNEIAKILLSELMPLLLNVAQANSVGPIKSDADKALIARFFDISSLNLSTIQINKIIPIGALYDLVAIYGKSTDKIIKKSLEEFQTINYLNDLLKNKNTNFEKEFLKALKKDSVYRDIVTTWILSILSQNDDVQMISESIINEIFNSYVAEKNKDISMLYALIKKYPNQAKTWKEKSTKKTLLHILAQNLEIEDQDQSNEYENLETCLDILKDSINVQDSVGRTALSYACENQDIGVVMIPLLINLDADIEIKDSKKKSAFDYIKNNDVKQGAYLCLLGLYYEKSDFPKMFSAAKMISNKDLIWWSPESNNSLTLYDLATQHNNVEILSRLKDVVAAELNNQYKTWNDSNEEVQKLSTFDEIAKRFQDIAKQIKYVTKSGEKTALDLAMQDPIVLIETAI